MTTGLAVFDTTVQETNEWLKAVQSALPPCDRQQAYAAARAVLHVLRDRLPSDAALGLSAQLPMLARGFFLEGWRPADGLSDIRTPSEFIGAVAARLPPGFPREADGATRAVLQTLSSRIDAHESRKIMQQLPAPLRSLWSDGGAPA